ncbi:conserved hypothetical protein [Anaeromyxobacter dehalogenans 2CP-1]|uniref:Uncharacterized protein n=1 Tax=Anaeromyxobacter dehalogenans (strain ATCC BAA-258 / DSM 21875 / 2CP-1) TaxID=455488 RepID=B8J6I9_ANAD2|nr:hypothetical protein [Anaeromyxobacter dehalogenans]ACL65170.1 conserved hypothetical protein [Anaeromyxobacter dehalogenans 2CP-1]
MRTRPIGLAAGVVLAFLAGHGCSSGGGDGPAPAVCEGAPDPGTAGPGDVEGWFPLAPGWSWSYRIAGQPVTRPADLRIEVGGARSYRGFAATELRELDPTTGADLAGGTALVASAQAGLVELGDGTATDPTPSTYDLRYPVTMGGAWSERCTGLDYGEDLDEDGKHETLDLALAGQVLGLEDVTVPAGTFAGAAHVRLTLTLTLYPTRAGLQPVTATAWQETWYARGVGIVRRSDGGELSPTTAYELVGWSGPAGGGGLAELTRLVVPPPSSDPYVSPWRVVPARGGSSRAMVLDLAWRDGPVRLVGRFVDGGAAGAPVEVVPQWPATSALLPWHMATQVAPGPDRHLVAFAAEPAQAPGTAEIRAARVTADGVALDGPSGFLVAQCASWTAYAVAASRAGDGYLVTWGCSAPAGGVYAATVGADGTVGAPTFLGEGPVQFLQAAGRGAEHLVVWGRGSSADTEVVGVRVSAAGTSLDAAPVRLVADQDFKVPGDLACGDAACLLTWRRAAMPYGSYELAAVRLAPGALAERAAVRLAGPIDSETEPLAVPVGDQFAITWGDPQIYPLPWGQPGPAVRVAWAGADLSLSPPDGIPVLYHWDFYDALGNAALLSAGAADAWVAYEWIPAYPELDAVHWIR